jgi:hypothetical protein
MSDMARKLAEDAATCALTADDGTIANAIAQEIRHHIARLVTACPSERLVESAMAPRLRDFSGFA